MQRNIVKIRNLSPEVREGHIVHALQQAGCPFTVRAAQVRVIGDGHGGSREIAQVEMKDRQEADAFIQWMENNPVKLMNRILTAHAQKRQIPVKPNPAMVMH